MTIAAENRPDAGDNFTGAERLRDIVIRPKLQPADLVVLTIARGQHDNRNGHQRPDPAGYFPAVQVGQHQVQDDEVRRGGLHRTEGRLAIGRDDHTMTIPLQVRLQQAGDLLLIINNEHCGHAHSLSRYPACPLRHGNGPRGRWWHYGRTPSVSVTSTRFASRRTPRRTLCPG